MTVCITVEHRFERTPDGAVWTQSNHAYEDTRRYLDVFDQVCIVARVRDVPAASAHAVRADGEGVFFSALPYWVGFGQFCLHWRKVRRAALHSVGEADAVILKAPSIISSLIEPALVKSGRPFAVEVLGDPWGVFSKGSIDHPLRPFIRRFSVVATKRQCRKASAVRYVGGFLQASYPGQRGACQVAVSDVYLPPGTLANSPRLIPHVPAPLRLISVGALEQPYKGIDVLLRALRLCTDRGFECRATVIGDGRYRPMLESLARELGVDRMVNFRGTLPSGEKVFAALDESDLFVMPSRLEGMPRAMIEAMARALPCIGSVVGGIPELLAVEDLVTPEDHEELAARIMEAGGSAARLREMSHRCLQRARDFEPHVLRERWHGFLRHLRSATESWNEIAGGKSPKAFPAGAK